MSLLASAGGISGYDPNRRTAPIMKNRRFDTFHGQIVLKGPLVLSEMNVLDHDDVTVYEESKRFLATLGEAIAEPHPEDLDNRKSFDLIGNVVIAGTEAAGRRIHAASCCDGRYFSVTIRKPPKSNPPVIWEPRELPDNDDWCSLASYFGCKCLAEDDWKYTRAYPARLLDLSHILHGRLENSTPAGLVLVSGSTGSGKTTVLNGILLRLLAAKLRNKPRRRPHVVVIGDPIETVFDQFELVDYCKRPLDFTPRSLGKDVESVQQALKDALRETPEIVVVNELRESADFRAALAFAETGHLLLATAHTTSLIDAMRKLMRFSTTVDSPSGRSLLVQRLSAVIHLRKVLLPNAAAVTLPSLWLHNSSGTRNFVSDGLSSLLPRGSSTQGAQYNGVLGLAWAAAELQPHLPRFKHQKNDFKTLLRTAHRLDLEMS